MDFNTKMNCAEAVLKNYLSTNGTITSLELKNQLISQHPNEYWTQNWCSDYLMQSGLSFDDNGTYRTYYANATLPTVTPLNVLDTSSILNAAQHLVNNNRFITKTNLKSLLHLQQFDLSNFKELFNQCSFEHNGNYTNDNHKIYTIVKKGQHFSKTKQKSVAITDIPKPYIVNTLFHKYETTTIGEVLSKSTDEEVYQLLKALFTFEVRQSLK